MALWFCGCFLLLLFGNFLFFLLSNFDFLNLLLTDLFILFHLLHLLHLLRLLLPLFAPVLHLLLDPPNPLLQLLQLLILNQQIAPQIPYPFRNHLHYLLRYLPQFIPLFTLLLLFPLFPLFVLLLLFTFLFPLFLPLLPLFLPLLLLPLPPQLHNPHILTIQLQNNLRVSLIHNVRNRLFRELLLAFEQVAVEFVRLAELQVELGAVPVRELEVWPQGAAQVEVGQGRGEVVAVAVVDAAQADSLNVVWVLL